jgi:type I restriction-modification system DNA methylase subunit
LASLLDEINKIDTLKDEANDLIGRVYEYFLSKFAIAEGKGKGEFYTPKSIVNLIAELIQPYEGKIYDPCCGSGGMFVQSLKFVDAPDTNDGELQVEVMKEFAERYPDMHILDWQRIIADYTPLVREAAKRPSANVIEMQKRQYGMAAEDDRIE